MILSSVETVLVEALTSTEIRSPEREFTMNETSTERMSIADLSKDEILRNSSVFVILVCSPLSLSLIPSRSNLSFRRNQDLYFSSLVESECRSSFVLQYRWSIDNGSSSISAESSSLLHSSDLFIRSQTLPLGTYRIELTVTRNNLSSETKSTFVRITPSGIRANLVLFGTSMIDVGVEQDLQLNPGKHSLDLDGKQFNASVEFMFSLGLKCEMLLFIKDWTYEYFYRIAPTLNSSSLFQSVNDSFHSNCSTSSIQGRSVEHLCDVCFKFNWRCSVAIERSEWFSSFCFVDLSTFVRF